MDRIRDRTLAGVSFVMVGVILLLGFVTAESQFPGYSTSTQTISALGSARGTPASRAVFNGAMVLSGGVTLVAAYGLHGVYGRRGLTALVAVTGLGGLVGVGVFPAETGLPHFLAAVIAFGGIGVTALVVAATVRGPFRYLSAGLGVLELLAFVAFVTVGGATPLGIGGLERWVAYLGIAWATAFGGFLLPRGTTAT
ncbi:DUF998 domain-containing protein [Haloparvum sp. AD34]